MTILKRTAFKQPKLVDVSYGYETSTGARGCSFDTSEKANEWLERLKVLSPDFANSLKPIKVTVTTTKEPF